MWHNDNHNVRHHSFLFMNRLYRKAPFRHVVISLCSMNGRFLKSVGRNFVYPSILCCTMSRGCRHLDKYLMYHYFVVHFISGNWSQVSVELNWIYIMFFIFPNWLFCFSFRDEYQTDILESQFFSWKWNVSFWFDDHEMQYWIVVVDILCIFLDDPGHYHGHELSSFSSWIKWPILLFCWGEKPMIF